MCSLLLPTVRIFVSFCHQTITETEAVSVLVLKFCFPFVSNENEKSIFLLVKYYFNVAVDFEAVTSSQCLYYNLPFYEFPCFTQNLQYCYRTGSHDTVGCLRNAENVHRLDCAYKPPRRYEQQQQQQQPQTTRWQ